MTKFADQLYDDLMREHGSLLADTKPHAASRPRIAPRRALLAAGAGGLAIAAAVGGLVAGGGSPAYALTTNPDGTITLAVYRASGIAGANARLRQLGDQQVVVVPIEPGCPRPAAPAVSGRGHRITMGTALSPNGSVTVHAQGIPAGDILVVGVETSGHSSLGVATLTSPPAPSCINGPASPPGHGGSG